MHEEPRVNITAKVGLFMSIKLPTGAGHQFTTIGAKSNKTCGSDGFVTSFIEIESHNLSETELLAKKLGLIEYDHIQQEFILSPLLIENFIPKKNHKRFIRKKPSNLKDRMKSELYRLNAMYKPSKLIKSKESKKIAVQKDELNFGIYCVYEFIERKMRPAKNEISLKKIRQTCALEVTQLLRLVHPDKSIQIRITEQNISDVLRLFDKTRD